MSRRVHAVPPPLPKDEVVAGGEAVCEDCSSSPAVCGGRNEGVLEDGDCAIGDGSFVDVWTLTVVEPRTVDVSMGSEDFDAVLFLVDADCEIVAGNDDSGPGTTDSRLVVDVPAGTYFLVSNSFLAGETGRYRMEVECREIRLCAECEVGVVSCNRPVESELSKSGCRAGDDSFVDLWRFDLPEATEVELELRSASFEPVLMLLDGSCLVAENTATCGESGPELACLDVPLAPGTYHVGVRSSRPEGRGAYELEVSCPALDLCRLCERGAIACGGRVTGRLGGETPCTLERGSVIEYYRLEVEAPSRVTARLASEEIDALLALLDDDCLIRELNDDCDATLDSCLSVSLPPGTYHLGASSAFRGEEGHYALSLECEPLPAGQVPGDCNQDAVLDISDPVCLLGFLFLGSPLVLPCGDGTLSDAGNVDLLDIGGDGQVDLSDAVATFDFLFLGGPPPVGGTECGPIPGCPEACGG